jgi:DNA-binding transcriptional MerR regulator
MITPEAFSLTTSAVARALDKSESTVRKYDREGRLPSIRSSSNIRLFRAIDVERLRLERANRG